MSAPLRVLYSFPHRIGAARICTTAWHQVEGLAAAGAAVTVMPASVVRPLPADVAVLPTLAPGGWRIPYRLIGKLRALRWHDEVVARRLARAPASFDVVHAWPLGSLRTLEVAARLGIPTFLERPNTHTRFAYAVVRAECERIGVALPHGHEHAFDERVLAREEAEYRCASALLCPSAFVARTFLDAGYPAPQLRRHRYGFDPRVYRPAPRPLSTQAGLEVLFVGGCAPRKGLHFALAAWLCSTACTSGRLRIAGAFVPGYAEHLATMLAHPSVEVLGHRTDVAQLMRESDILVLPSIEEGSALVTSEARGSGCVLLVSDAAGAVAEHLGDALVHPAGDLDTLRAHFDLVHGDRPLLARLRSASLAGSPGLTWEAAGRRLLAVYQETQRDPASADADVAERTGIGHRADRSTRANTRRSAADRVKARLSAP